VIKPSSLAIGFKVNEGASSTTTESSPAKLPQILPPNLHMQLESPNSFGKAPEIVHDMNK